MMAAAPPCLRSICCRSLTAASLLVFSSSVDRSDLSESVALRDQVYPDSDRLSYDYIFQHKDALRTRLTAAGWRIAAYLNAACEAVPAACAP